MEDTNLIQVIIDSLNLIEVRGQDNLSRMYNSIHYLRQLKELLEKEKNENVDITEVIEQGEENV